MTLDLSSPRVRTILSIVGVRYVYGAGQPSDGLDLPGLSIGVTSTRDPETPAKRKRGWDCGVVAVLGVALGDYSPRQPDRTVHMLAMESLDAITEPEAVVGDIVLYEGNAPGRIEHAAMVVGPGLVVTMSGGSRDIFGNTPTACGQVRPWGYRRIKTFARWKASVRP